MSSFHAIALAIDLATRQRDGQAQKLAQVLRNVAVANDQMAQLTGYAADTDARWTAGGSVVGLSAELIRHHCQFMDRLQGAVQLQRGVIADLEAQVGTTRQALLQAEYRLAGLNKVLQSRKAQHANQLARREQRMTDEFAAQRHARNGAARLGETI